MKDMFSAGELAKYQNISKQTLLYYDKIGLFKPRFVDPINGYRYYSAEQLDYLDSILIMKKLGIPLEDIKEHLEHFTTENSLVFLKQQLAVIEQEIAELSLIKHRLSHRIFSVQQVYNKVDHRPFIEEAPALHLLCENVKPPYSSKEISLTTKQLYAKALKDNLPIFFESGVSVPLEHLNKGMYIEATICFLPIDNVKGLKNIKKLPRGKVAAIYHFGSYETIGESYQALIQYCNDQHLKIISNSYEFCINDYITSKYEEEFITKIMFYIE